MSAPHEIHIGPNRSWFAIEWRELWEYRDLLWLMTRRDLVSKYKQTILGPLWFIVQPVLTTVVFTIIFGRVARIPTDGFPPFLFYLCGMLSWSYFATNMNATASTFTSNAHLFGKVYFPRLIIPLATSFSNLAAFAVQLITFAGFWIYFKFAMSAGSSFSLTPALIFLPLVIAYLITLSLGVSLWMSAMSAKYRDFAHLMAFLTQLWMYATPIVYPLSIVPDRWRWLMELNPMTVATEWFRLAFLGQGEISAQGIMISLAMTLILFVSGVMIFQKTARTFIDTV